MIRAVTLCICIGLACIIGCANGGGASHGAAKPVTSAELRSLAMNAADSYATTIEQACDQVRAATTQPAVVDWAWQTKINTNLASFTNASGPNDAEALLDMVLYATLKRCAMEEYWIPTLLHEEGKPALALYKRAEADVWNTAGKALTSQQQDEMRALIDRWRREHPGQYYVVHVRLSNLADDLGVDIRSPAGHAPDSVLALLYVDPLAGLNPVTAELRNYRSMSERMMYMSVRMPRMLGWQAEYAALRASATPEVHHMLDTADRFAAVATTLPAELFAERQKALVQVQQLVKAEREAAVNQVDQRISGQREALAAELTRQSSDLRRLIGDVNALVRATEDAALTVNDSTNKTIISTEQAGRRTMKLGFWLALILLLALIIAPFVTLLAYRLAVKRWVAPVPAPEPGGMGKGDG